MQTERKNIGRLRERQTFIRCLTPGCHNKTDTVDGLCDTCVSDNEKLS
jgi:hypothetical protein